MAGRERGSKCSGLKPHAWGVDEIAVRTAEAPARIALELSSDIDLSSAVLNFRVAWLVGKREDW